MKSILTFLVFLVGSFSAFSAEYGQDFLEENYRYDSDFYGQRQEPPGREGLGKVEFTCSRRELWLEGEDIKLGRNLECEQAFVYSIIEGRREKFGISAGYRRAHNSSAVDETFGLSETAFTAVLRARLLPWLRTALIHYRAEPPGEGEAFEFWGGYGVVSGLDGFPVDSLTLGQERDNSSTLSIGHFQKNLGSREGRVSGSFYGGVSQLDQTFRSGVERQDLRWLGAIQVNLHDADQSMILGVGDQQGGPMSYMVGLHGALSRDRRNEWTTLCRVRQTKDAADVVRETEFCIVHIGIGNERLAARGRYMDFLGTFVPGMIKPTRIVNGTTLSDNPNVSSVQSFTDRPKWNFVATRTKVEIIDDVDLDIESVELSRSFSGQFGKFHNPYVAAIYMGTNYLYFDAEARALKGTDMRRELALALGAAFGYPSSRWDTEIRLGWDMKHQEPTFRGTVHRFFNH